jgi:hypothetical protein
LSVLNLPDEQDDIVRAVLLEHDNKTLELLAMKSKDEIKLFIFSAEAKDVSSIQSEKIIETKKQDNINDRIEAKL